MYRVEIATVGNVPSFSVLGYGPWLSIKHSLLTIWIIPSSFQDFSWVLRQKYISKIFSHIIFIAFPNVLVLVNLPTEQSCTVFASPIRTSRKLSDHKLECQSYLISIGFTWVSAVLFHVDWFGLLFLIELFQKSLWKDDPGNTSHKALHIVFY